MLYGKVLILKQGSFVAIKVLKVVKLLANWLAGGRTA